MRQELEELNTALKSDIEKTKQNILRLKTNLVSVQNEIKRQRKILKDMIALKESTQIDLKEEYSKRPRTKIRKRTLH